MSKKVRFIIGLLAGFGATTVFSFLFYAILIASMMVGFEGFPNWPNSEFVLMGAQYLLSAILLVLVTRFVYLRLGNYAAPA